jgi:hypothetical protein
LQPNQFFWHCIGITLIKYADMVIDKNNAENAEQEWENPMNPEKPTDERDKEQVVRQYKEAKRLKNNLTEKGHIDKVKKNS